MYPDDYDYSVMDESAYMRHRIMWDDTRILAVDTETTGLRAREDTLVSLQVATPDWCYVFNAGFIPDAVKAMLEDPKRTLLLQHAPFDFGFLLHHAGIDISKANVYDTRVEEKILDPLGGHSLAKMHKKYLGFDLDKSPQTSFKVGETLTKEQARYAAVDALCLFPIALGQGIERTRFRFTEPPEHPFKTMREYVLSNAPWPERR
jgi:ribonuclease D